MCCVSDDRCAGLSAVIWLFGSSMHCLLVVCAVVYVIVGDARPLFTSIVNSNCFLHVRHGTVPVFPIAGAPTHAGRR